jgi:hypothetical protein
MTLPFGLPVSYPRSVRHSPVARAGVRIATRRRTPAIRSRVHDQHPFAPEEVDEVGASPNVYLRRREAMVAAETQEGSLEIAAGAIAASLVINWQSKHIRLADRAP